MLAAYGLPLSGVELFGGYIGESTRREIEYAERNGKKVNYLEPVN